MAVKKGGYKTGGEGNEGKVTRTTKATAFDSDMYKKDREKRSMTKNDAYRVEAKDGGCMQIKGFGKARRPKKKKYA
jgi:hypothetical protein